MERTVTRIVPAEELKARKRVAAYARVSLDKDSMLHSLSAQISYYSELIQKNAEWEYVGVYADRGLTGTKENRPEFQRLLVDCRAGKIDLVLVKSISRFARNTVTLLKTVRELKALGVDVYFEEHNIHTLSGDGELMLSVLASFAQEESRSVSDNCKWRIRKMFEEGLPTGFTLYGYSIRKGHFTIILEEAEVVQRIASMFLSGLGRVSIVNVLNKEGIPSPEGLKWSPSVVDGILRNEKYAGALLLQKYYVNNHIEKKTMPNKGELPQYYVEDDHEAIIPMETHLLIRMEIERRAVMNTGKVYDWSEESDNLVGKVVCGICGWHYRRKMTAARTKYAKRVWICGRYSLYGKAACASKRIPEETLLEIIGSALMHDPAALRSNLTEIRALPRNRLILTFANGETIERIWEDHSRRDSWDAAMREQARLAAMTRCRERRVCING